MSVVDPNPVIKLILDGVTKKVLRINCSIAQFIKCCLFQLRTIRKLCENEFLVGLLHKTAPCVRDCTLQGVCIIFVHVLSTHAVC